MDSCQVHLGTTVAEIEARLQAMSSTLSSDSVYLHIKPVAYKNSQAKANWIKFSGQGTMDMDIHSKWLRAKTDRKSISLAMFCTWTETWVGKKDISGINWHAWCAALVKEEGIVGKKLYIWDPDQPQHGSKTRISEVLLGGQRALVDSTKATSLRLCGVHLANGNSSKTSRVQDCLLWIEKILSSDGFPVEDFQVLKP